MNDPHVEALIYVVEHDKKFSYEKAKSLEDERPLFRIKVENGRARFEPEEHHATKEAARAEVQPFIDQWEFQAALEHGIGAFTLRFERPEIVDRQPTPGVIAVSAGPAWFHFAVSEPTVTVYKQYPQPPSEGAMDTHHPDVRTMRHRYEGYRQGHEPGFRVWLISVAKYGHQTAEQQHPGRRRQA